MSDELTIDPKVLRDSDIAARILPLSITHNQWAKINLIVASLAPLYEKSQKISVGGALCKGLLDGAGITEAAKAASELKALRFWDDRR